LFSPDALGDALDEAFHRAQGRTAPVSSVPFSPASRAVDDSSALGGAGPFDEPEIPEPLLSGDQLLYLLRVPIDWLLTLAQRLAAADPDDIAAVERLRAAFFTRVAGRSVGWRVTDVLQVAGILVGALDLDVVLDAAAKTLGEGMATMMATQQAGLAAQLAALADTLPMAVRHTRARRPHHNSPTATGR
jgi:hypothetical protein